MPPSAHKAILLIELLDVGLPYAAAEVIKCYAAIVSAHGGNHINAVGKKIVCSLGNPNAAAETACELMACNFPGKKPGRPISRMCVCQLPTGMENKDAHTRAISGAVRELIKAKAGQIVTTQETAANLSAQFEIKFGVPDGITGVRVFEIQMPVKPQPKPTQPEQTEWYEATRIAAPSDRPGKRLRLLWRQRDLKKEIVLHSAHPVITFGREGSNDIAIDSDMASRRHGHLEFREGSIYIIDDSTNGTFVVPFTGAKFMLHKSEELLPPRGHFCLGVERDANHPHAIQFITVFSAG
ncbi:MAG: FHA domain-containing protein [Sulfuricellaceae bacterium]